MERRCSRWNSFKSSMPSDLQSSKRKESRAGRCTDSCFRCFLLPEHTATLLMCLWARLCQKDRLYCEKCRRTRLKPRHRGRDLSSSCLKSEQVQRTFSLSFQGRKLKTWSHSSSGSCDTGIAIDSGRFPVLGLLAYFLLPRWRLAPTEVSLRSGFIGRLFSRGWGWSDHWNPPIGRFRNRIEPTLQQQAAKFKKGRVIVAGRLFKAAQDVPFSNFFESLRTMKVIKKRAFKKQMKTLGKGNLWDSKKKKRGGGLMIW